MLPSSAFQQLYDIAGPAYANPLQTPKPHPAVEVPLSIETPPISKLEPDANVTATLDKINTSLPQDRRSTMPSRHITETEQPVGSTRRDSVHIAHLFYILYATTTFNFIH